MVKRILVAEDEPNIAISLHFLLTGAGHEVTIAHDGSQALELAGRLRPDLVVVDVMLPAMNGYELCRQLRLNPAVKPVRILMLTARGRQAEVDKGLAAGADAYMAKPFSTRELVETVAALLAPAPE